MDLFSCKDKLKKLCMAAPLCLIWAIWKERNHTVFEDMHFSYIRLKNSFISSFALGRLYRFGGGFFCAFSEFVFWGGRFFLLPSFL